MTTDKLRDLLHEQVSDLTMTDLSAAAWRDGRRIRRRRTVAVVGGTAAAALAVTTGVSVLGDEPRPGPAGPATSSPTPTPTSTPSSTATPSGPDGRYAGADLWNGPEVADEAALPRLEGTGLPAEIDLSPGAPPAVGIGRAVAVLGVWPDGDLSRAVAVGADGASYSVPIEGTVERVADEGGNVMSPLGPESLSPRGSRVFFFQERSLEVYDFHSGEWSSIATPPYLAEGARWVTETEIWVPDRLGETGSGTSYDVSGGEPRISMVRWLGQTWAGSGSSQAFGPLKTTADATAQAYFLSDGTEGLVATHGDPTHRQVRVLGFEVRDGRWKGCCPAVGWSGPDTVLFESRSAEARVLAWRVGSAEVLQVSTIVGWAAGQESYVASWSLPEA